MFSSFNKKTAEDLCQNLSQKLADILPSGLKDRTEQCKEKYQEQIKSVLLCAFEKLELVTREDFDLQLKKLQALQSKVTELEEKVSNLLHTQH